MKADLIWHLFISCPNCNELIDLSDHDEDGIFSIPIFNNKWDDIKDIEFECPECEHEFIIDGVEY